MRFPISGRQTTVAVDTDRDAAVDYRDQMRVSDQVQNVTAPGTVDTSDQHITIQSRPKAFLFIYSGDYGFYPERISSRARRQVFGHDHHLEFTDIAPRRIGKP